jgi:O-antigen ligase
VNRNHLAGLLAMALPILVAVWAVETLPGRDAHGAVMREHPRHADQRLARRMVVSLAVVLVLAALVLTRSRAGIACGLAAFGAAGLAIVWGGASARLRTILGAVALVAFALAAYAGLTPVVDRFSAGELALGYEGRARILAATLQAGVDFLPLGSGLGTFADVFPRYQAAGPVGYVEFAHNDYAQAFLELGLAGLAAMGLLAFAYGARWRTIARGGGSRRLGLAQVAAGISLAALGAHGLFDFNLHIPANALVFAFLAGVFFYPSRA